MADVPVHVTVSGANTLDKQVRTDANGEASFSYVAVNAGADTVSAFAGVDGTGVASNPARVTWTAGAHTSFLTLNGSPKGGTLVRSIFWKARLFALKQTTVLINCLPHNCVPVCEGDRICRDNIIPTACCIQ